MPAGHSRPNGQLLESLCTKPVVVRMGTLPVAPRARSPRAVRERRGRDLPRPRVALGHGQDFAYLIDPSHHVHRGRIYQFFVLYVRFLVSNFVILPIYAESTSKRLIHKYHSLPWGWGPNRSGKEERRPVPDSDRTRSPPGRRASSPIGRATCSIASRGARASRARSAAPARSTRSRSGFRISDRSAPSRSPRSRLPVCRVLSPVFGIACRLFSATR